MNPSIHVLLMSCGAQRDGHNSKTTAAAHGAGTPDLKATTPATRSTALQPSTPSWLPNLHVYSGFDAVPSRPCQKVGSRKLQGVIVPASRCRRGSPSPDAPQNVPWPCQICTLWCV